jgi:hypothetical protein
MDKIAYFERENPEWKTPNPTAFTAFMNYIHKENRIVLPDNVTWQEEWMQRMGHYQDASQLMRETEMVEVQVLDAIAQIQEAQSAEASKNMFSIKRYTLEGGFKQSYMLDISVTTQLDKWTVPVTTVHQYYRNAIYCLLHMYPRMVLGTGLTTAWKAPKHWSYSPTHKAMLQDRVNQFSGSFAAFRGDAALQEVLQTFQRITAHYWDW